MWTKKVVGISTLALSVLLLSIVFLSTAYEINAFAAYVESLEENKQEAFGVFAIVIYMIFSAPLACVFSIILLVTGIRFLRGKAGQKAHTLTLVIKALSAVGLLILFIAYRNLYPAGWISKTVYLVTAILSFISFALDIFLVNFVKVKEVESQKTENEK